ncbi:hypothetical protein JYU34_020353 [Plutella xylostella]|uniref:Uncharacterized protein n=1 Tax=Plutella xylostella TaxID=51655 RepID=A0ABQ7PUC5_PLUXY|nr:hypothetical protein JYU34_020353 [Plutella xylostella]
MVFGFGSLQSFHSYSSTKMPPMNLSRLLEERLNIVEECRPPSRKTRTENKTKGCCETQKVPSFCANERALRNTIQHGRTQP